MNRTNIALSIALFLLAFTIRSLAQTQFQNVRPVISGYNITSLPGDYDNDGDMDILGTGSFIDGGTSNMTTVLLRNDGGEFFAVDIQLGSLYFGSMYQWADIDNDNDLDIITGGCLYCYESKPMSIYRNDGLDSFTLVTQETNLIGGPQFSLADYTNDGLMDIEIAYESDNDVIIHTFYKNVGNFVFQKTFELQEISGETTWGDLDNDGWKDFVLLNQAYRNLQNGTFQAFSQEVIMQQRTRHFLFDADQDGDQDVITDNGILMKNDGNGQLSFGEVLIPYNYVGALFAADFDGDGDRDMLVSGASSTGNATQVFRSNGDGTFTPEDLNEQPLYINSLAVADMDDDGDIDILSGSLIGKMIIIENGLTTRLQTPGVPDNLHYSATADAITLSWDAATDHEQPPSSLEYNVSLMYGDDFRIAPGADLTTGKSFIPGKSNVSSARQIKLEASDFPEGYYRWGVQTVDAEMNTSKFSILQEFTLYKNNPANAPTNLEQTSIADRLVSLAWTDNANNETTFTIERSSMNGNAGFVAIHDVASNTINYTDNTVSPRSVYYYRIRLNGSAVLAYSNVIRVETKASIAIEPTNVTASALNSASGKINWEYSGIGITGFVIERSPNDNKHFAVLGSVSAEKRTYTDQQLESGKTYYYRLFAVNGEDVSGYSNMVKVSVPLKEFSKITLSSLMYESRYLMGGIAWGDFDNDGYDDLFLGYQAQLFHNEGNGTFDPIPETGIVKSTTANDFVAVWGDYDNDGYLDLFYYNDQDKSRVYRGHGDGTFTGIVTSINADLSRVTNATWTDFDMDGDLDLSITGGRYIYRYDGNDTFVRINLPGGILGGYYNSSVASWADYDDDGDPDLFLGNYGKDEFFSNNGDGSFTTITDQRITKDYNYDCCPIETPTALWTDFNNDRKIDLTVFHAGSPIYIYANRANTFDSAFFSYEYSQSAWKNLFWTDYDIDGDLDLFSMGQYNGRPNIWENQEGKSLRLLKGGPLYDYVPSDAAFSWNDFDNDGYSDLFQFDENHQIYKNLSNGNNWIKIRLKGRQSNSTGLGAKIFVKSNAGWQRSDVTTHHSYRIQQGFMSLFGLGNAAQVDSIKVIWPTGNRQYLTNVEVNQVILIDEGDAQEKVTQGPSNLTAEVEFPSSITLKWTDRTEGETGFAIEMAIGEGQFATAGTVGANVNLFKINGLSVGVKYKFRVSLVSNNKWTNTVEAQIRLFTEVFGGDLTTLQSRPGGMAWGDPDNDGDPDLFLGSESFEPDAIYYNDHGSFKRKYLRNTSNYSRQAQWIDYNNDGYQDLHITVGGGIIASSDYLNDFLYKNNRAGQLIEQTDNLLGKDGYPDFTAAWGDLNKDGYLEMITSRSNGHSMVYLNLGGNMTPQESSGLIQSEAGLILLSDLDNDRDLDVISSGLFGYQSVVYENVNGQFTPIANSGLPSSFYFFVMEDFDNDGAQDLLAIDQDQVLRLFLLDPVSKKFSEKMNVFPPLSPVSKLSAGDFDNNGFVDVMVTGQVSFTSNTNRIFLNNGNLKFNSLEDPILKRNLFGTAIAEVNKDGHLDIIAVASGNDNSYYDTRRYLLQGNKNTNHWLRIKLNGLLVNRFGIGARIRLFIGNTSQMREIRSGSGGTFSDEQIAHFGIGNATAIDYIKVEWPSGEDQWIANPSIDTEMVVEQASSPGPPAPLSPSNLTATFRSPRYIDLQWLDNSSNEKMFRIERAVGTGSFELVRNVPANTTSFTDTTLSNYSEYRSKFTYRIVAISLVSVESDPSNEASLSVITGLEDKTKNLLIYPQPASSKVFIQSESPIRNITIIGSRGETIKEISVTGLREVEVPLHGFAPGIYFMRIKDDDGTNVRKILVTSGD